MSFRTLVVTFAALAAVMAAGCGGEATDAIETRSVAEPWQPTPYTIDDAIIRTADAACRDLQVRVAGIRAALEPVVIDVRGGGNVFLVYAGDDIEADCLVPIANDGTANSAGGGNSSGNAFDRLPAGTVSVISGSSGGAGSSVIGRVGPGVARVEFGTAGGRRIQASLDPTGWFAAWWPGADAYGPVTAFDALGTVTGTAR